MRMATAGRRACGFVIALAIAVPASAQSAAKAEVSAGYQVLGLKSGADETLGKGWYADLAGNIGRYFAVVGQVSGNYKTVEETETFSGITSSVKVDFKVHEFMGGVRVHAHPNSTVIPFAQFIVGGVNGSAKVEGSVTGGGQTFFSTSTSDSSTDFGMQMGGGVTVWLNKSLGIRGAADYIRVLGDGEDLNAWRAAGGVVFGF